MFKYLLVLLPAPLLAEITLVWQHPDPTATYTVYRAPGACGATSAFVKLGTATARSYADSPPTGQHCYRVTATVAGLESAPSTPISYTAAPAAPSDLKIDGVP
jgi:hypothetical protein